MMSEGQSGIKRLSLGFIWLNVYFNEIADFEKLVGNSQDLLLNINKLFYVCMWGS